ncbi:MAG TPA: helix-turn-helix transcriptional regulator [Thermodesulfobacteriota bacterium]|jgi:DNA-binding Xre family transcriptional regulator
MARIACRLRVLLAERNMTRVKLSTISGIPLNTLAPLYHDKWHRVDRKTIDRICNALNVTYKELFENNEEQGDLFKYKNK